MLDKIKRSSSNYSNEFNNLKAKDSEYKNTSEKKSNTNSRHNSNADNLSWRKGSTENSMEYNNFKKGNNNTINEK